MTETIKFGRYGFEVNNSNKVLFPEVEITKSQLMDYYEHIAPVMLPYTKDRPLTMIRYPDGVGGKHFYQKDVPEYFPDWITTEKIRNKGEGTTEYVVCNNKSTLVYLASQAAITPHVWLSRRDNPDTPDRLVFDLDPAEDDFSSVVFAAKSLRKLLYNELELPVYAMTTGSRGMHIVVPLRRFHSFEETRQFAQDLAHYLEQQYPDKLTTAQRKDKRENKLFIDTTRNAFGQTTVAPYAIRPIKEAPVATPVEWDEVNSGLSARKYTLDNIFRRLGQTKDPWRKMALHAVSLNKAREKLNQLIKE